MPSAGDGPRRYRAYRSARVLAKAPIGCGLFLIAVVVREVVDHGLPMSVEGFVAVGAWLLFAAGWILAGTYFFTSAIELDSDTVTSVHAFGLRRKFPRGVMRFRHLPGDKVHAYMPSASWIRRTLSGFRVQLGQLEDREGFLRAIGLR